MTSQVQFQTVKAPLKKVFENLLYAIGFIEAKIRVLSGKLDGVVVSP